MEMWMWTASYSVTALRAPAAGMRRTHTGSGPLPAVGVSTWASRPAALVADEVVDVGLDPTQARQEDVGDVCDPADRADRPHRTIRRLGNSALREEPDPENSAADRDLDGEDEQAIQHRRSGDSCRVAAQGQQHADQAEIRDTDTARREWHDREQSFHGEPGQHFGPGGSSPSQLEAEPEQEPLQRDVPADAGRHPNPSAGDQARAFPADIVEQVRDSQGAVAADQPQPEAQRLFDRVPEQAGSSHAEE